MPIVDNRQPRADVNNSSTHDREGHRNKPKRVRKPIADQYERYGKTHYEKNKAAYIARSAAAKEKGRAEWAAFKATLSCKQCGENHPATLDFHHVVRLPENKKVFRLIGSGLFAQAKEEIKKCMVLCANCHRKLHHQEELDRKQQVV